MREEEEVVVMINIGRPVVKKLEGTQDTEISERVKKEAGKWPVTKIWRQDVWSLRETMGPLMQWAHGIQHQRN